jgi:hypothetical protein
MGVHEFKPSYRGSCFTKELEYSHPEIIKQNLPQLKQKFNKQLLRYKA